MDGNSSIKSYRSTASSNTARDLLNWLQKEKFDSKRDLMSQDVKEYTSKSEVFALQQKIQKQREIIKDLNNKLVLKPKNSVVVQIKRYQEMLKKSQEVAETKIDEVAKLRKLITKKEEEFKEKLEEQKESFAKDLKNKHKIWQQIEQTSRERILQERTEKIKKQTIKMLEPDIEKLVQQNRIEIFKLKESHREELNNTISEIQKEQLQEVKKYQAEIIKIKDSTRQEENHKFDVRYQKLLEDNEWEIQKLKIRLENGYKEQLKKEENTMSANFNSKVQGLEHDLLIQSKSAESRFLEFKIQHDKVKEESLHELKLNLLKMHEDDLVSVKNKHAVDLNEYHNKFDEDVNAAKAAEIIKIQTQYQSKFDGQLVVKTQHLLKVIDDKMAIIDELRKSHDLAIVEMKQATKSQESLKSNYVKLEQSYAESDNEKQLLMEKISKSGHSKSILDLKHQLSLLKDDITAKDAHNTHLQDQLHILQRKHDNELELLQQEHQEMLELLKKEFVSVIASKNSQITALE